MGQYYHIAIKPQGGEVIYNDRKIEGRDEYTFAKLLEHSYNSCWLMKSVMKMLEDGVCKLAWVGDYAEEDEVREITGGEVEFDALWWLKDGEPPKERFTPLKFSKFQVSGKYLLNHTKKLYVPLKGGFFRSTYEFTDRQGKKTRHTDYLCPVSILTAIGNGRGGGDYSGKDEDLAGTWAWDEISISDKVPRGYSRLKHLPKKKDS